MNRRRPRAALPWGRSPQERKDRPPPLKRPIAIGITLFFFATIACAVIFLTVSPIYLAPISDGLTVPTREVTPAAANVITLAATDTPEDERVHADRVCSGTDDAEELQRIIDGLAPLQGTVRLLPGTYSLNRTVAVRAGMTLTSTRGGAAELRYDRPGWLEAFEGVVLDGLRVTGSGGVYIPASGVSVRDTEVSADHTRSAGFMVYASNRVIEDISFINCTARACGTSGFMNAGEGDVRQVRNVSYRDCSAIDCGRTGPRFNDWVVGFDIAETAEVSDVRLTGCLAEGNWESGFHEEKNGVIGPVVLENCTSRANGSKRGEVVPKYGAGYLVSGATVVQDCTSEKNVVGYYCTNGTMLLRTSDLGSVVGYRTTDGEEIVIEDCVSKQPARLALEALSSRAIRCVRFQVIDPGSAVASPIQIGSKQYPSTNISLTLELKGGRGETAVSIVNGMGIDLSALIQTGANKGIMIEGSKTAGIFIHNSRVLLLSSNASGITIEEDVNDAGSVTIDNSEITGDNIAYGVENRAAAPVIVSRVVVIGARVPFMNCQDG